MKTRWPSVLTALAIAVLVAGCGPTTQGTRGTAEPPRPTTSTTTPTTPTPTPALMPDLVGLTSTAASTRLGRFGRTTGFHLTSDWRPAPVRCEARPGTVVRQEPAPGTVVTATSGLRVWTGRLDLTHFRGPCETGELGPVRGADAALARAFYRFAADPSLTAPFVAGDVRTGIGSGPVAVQVPPSERAELAAWQLDTSYAERVGPFSALDVLALSGGYYELHAGVRDGCPSGEGTVAPELAGLRTLSLTAPAETTGACLDWWSVTLHLDDADRIAGVSLTLGSP